MLGLAVLTGSRRLLDYAIQLRKEAWSPGKRDMILASLQPWCASYTITHIALSIPYEKQTSEEMQELLESIQRFSREKQVPCFPYHTKALAAFWKENQKQSKKEVIGRIISCYPELTHVYQKEISNKNKYYMKLFEAVGVAVMHTEELSSKKAGR